MRNQLTTAFWQKAAQSLPAQYRARYLGYFERMERWELALEALAGLLAPAAPKPAARAHRQPRIA